MLTRRVVFASVALAAAGTVFAADAAFDTWSDMAAAMGAVLTRAGEVYSGGDAAGGKAAVDEAYYGFYEKLGFEKTVMAYLSGNRAAQVEYQFSLVKKSMSADAPEAQVKGELAELARFLAEDAARLDGKSESPAGVFAGSLVIITREGFEAIIIVGAIAAWLLKSGNKKKVRAVYAGSLAALALSVVLAWILNLLTGTGQNQELIEGFTMLTAVIVLFYVSNWMLGKSEAKAWTRYIEGMASASVSRGSVFSLSFAAFLAVFREGAETILFYQALLAQTQTYVNMVWLGLGVGIIALVVIFILIRVLSLRVPLKPFFTGTSILLFLMCVTFTGNGVKELQEGNLVGVTPLPLLPSIDILGVYPTAETLVPQVLLLAAAVVTFILHKHRNQQAV